MKKNGFTVVFYSFLLRLFRKNKIRVKKNNAFTFKGVFIKGCDVKVLGSGNRITFDPAVKYVGDLKIFINGNGNVVRVEEGCFIKNLSIWVEDDNNEIVIKKDTVICGNTCFSVIEGTKITVGEKCLFSDEITLRTGDSHSITDLNGNRINPSRDVCIGDKVWIGRGVSLLKGSKIPNKSIVGTGAVVTKEFDQDHVVIAGNPAKIVKEDVDWDFRRL